MSKYWSRIVQEIDPYVPGEQPKDRKYIKLNTNENPYPPSPKVLEAIRQAADEKLKLYPDPSCDSLKTAVAGYYHMEKDQVFVGNGSDEVLAFSFMAFFNPGKPVLFPDISYSFYTVYAGLFKIDYRQIPLNDDFSVPADMFLKDNGGVVLPNPNAPTARYLPLKYIEEIVRCNQDNVVIIDEAYIDFGGESAVKLINKYPNLLVVQTFSKSRSLAGLRVGFALGHPDLIEGLERVKNSFNSYTLDRIAMTGAVEAIKDEAYFKETCNKVIATREWTTKALQEMGFHVVESAANFIFAGHPKVPGADLFRQLRDHGILVRYFNKPRINNYLRISIGSKEEMNCLVRELKAIMTAYTI